MQESAQPLGFGESVELALAVKACSDEDVFVDADMTHLAFVCEEPVLETPVLLLHFPDQNLT